MFTRTLISVAMAAALAGCSPFSDDDPVNSEGSVNISGNYATGETLTANIVDADGVDFATATYVWKRDGAPITTASGSTYVLTAADVGGTITVDVSYTDNAGNVEGSVVSPTTATSIVQNTTGIATISGDTNAEETLTASVTDADGATTSSVTYIWKADDVAITGATSASYILTAAEIGKAITVEASYTDDAGTAEVVNSEPSSNVGSAANTTGSVSISGTVTSGQVLTADVTDDNGLTTSSITYVWKAGGDVIPGAVSQAYTLTDAEVGKVITVEVGYMDDAGTSESFTSDPTSIVAIAPQSTPNQVALITDSLNSDNGELRYRLDSDKYIQKGKVELSINYKANEEQTFYVVLFGSSTSTSDSIGEIQLSSGAFKTRTTESSGTTLNGSFTPDTVVDVVLSWDLSTNTYEITVPGEDPQSFPVFTTTAITAVENIQIKMGNKDAVTAIGVEVDNLVISKATGTTVDGITYEEVFSDDFEAQEVGTSLTADPYHDNTLDAIVALDSTESMNSTEEPTQVALITDSSNSDNGELRYRLDSDKYIQKGKVELSVNYKANEEQTFYVVLFGSSTSTSDSIGEIQFSSGAFKTRTTESSGTTLNGSFIPDTVVDVVLSWDLSTNTYEITVPGEDPQSFPVFTTTAITVVENIQIKMGNKDAVTEIGVEVDNLVISKATGTTEDGIITYEEVFSDDFETQTVGSSLAVEPYHNNTTDAIVAVSSITAP